MARSLLNSACPVLHNDHVSLEEAFVVFISYMSILLIENGPNRKTRAVGIEASLYRDGPGYSSCSTGSAAA